MMTFYSSDYLYCFTEYEHYKELTQNNIKKQELENSARITS